MRLRSGVVAATSVLSVLSLTGTLLLAPAAAAPPPARATDDSCPAGAVPEDALADVTAGAPHEDAVDCLLWWGVARGASRTAYAPEQGIRRDQMASFLLNLITASGGSLPPAATDHFTDDDDSVHEDRINRLADAGLVAGVGPGSYGPGLVVSRGQMASLLAAAYDERARQAGLPQLPIGPDAFSDDDQTTHEINIDRVAAAGIAAGTAGGGYAEREPVRRDQMASFVARTLDLLVEGGAGSPPVARAGQLDPSYAQQGIATVPIGERYDEGRAAALDGEGRLLVGGESSVLSDGTIPIPVRVWSLTRLLPDGSPDPAFGGDGTLTGEAGDPFRVLSVAVQPDGAVLAGGLAVCGRMCTASVLARFLPDGSPDASFGDGSRVQSELPETGPVRALTVDGSGRILAAGATRPTGANDLDDFAIARYLPTGALDPAFGGDGVVTTDLRGGGDAISGLAVRADGAIVAGGTSHAPGTGNGPVEPRFAVARYTDDGALDPSYGVGGTVETDLAPEPGSREELTSIAVTPDGAVLAAGHVRRDGTTPHAVVVRHTPAGLIDPAFGTAGVVEVDQVPASEATGVVLQDDDRVVLGGRAADHPAPPTPADPPGALGSATDWTWALVGLTADGRRDASFGDEGIARTPVGKGAHALVRAPDGRLLMAGCTCPEPVYRVGGEESPSRLVVARFLSSGDAEPSGTVDRRYGDGGLTSVQVGPAYSAARAAAVDGSGRLVMAGVSSRDVGLARLVPDGSPDPSFGQGGTVTTPVGGKAEANAVLVQPDGRVVAGGRKESLETFSFVLTRYLEDGVLDPTFGNGGIVVTDNPGYDEVQALAQLPDGRLLAVGSAVVDEADFRNTGLLVVRYLPDGRLDTTWGGDGSVVTDVRPALDGARSIAVLDDGRVVVGGVSNDPTGAQEGETVLVRHLPDGALDPDFGDGGTALADLGPGHDALGGVEVLPDGTLAAAARVDPYDSGPIALARFSPAGALQGVTTTDLGAPSSVAGLAVTGRRVLVGALTGDDTWAVVGFTADGALDLSYGRSGVARARAGKGVAALVVQPDGAAVLVGCDCPQHQYDRSGNESSSRFVAVRFQP